jgi:hypothetical protein
MRFCLNGADFSCEYPNDMAYLRYLREYRMDWIIYGSPDVLSFDHAIRRNIWWH